MGYWSVAALVVSLSFLAYRHHPEALKLLPLWLHNGSKRTSMIDRKDSDGFNKATNGNQSYTNTQSLDISIDETDEQSTPKANATAGPDNVPTFALSGEAESDKHEPSPPSFPAPNSAQRASTMAPPPRPSHTISKPPSIMGRPSPSSLMPPPARPAAGTRTPATQLNPTAGLRIPSTGPLPNRGPPANSQQRATGGLAPNGTAISTPNPRGKVLLSPGHSPMDWAALIRRGNISGVDRPQRVTPSQLKRMTGRKGKPAWSSWQGRVYNISPYLPFHPGGEAELMKAAGRDGTKLFMEVHPWVNWENMLGSCMVGVMVPEETSPLDEMD